MDMLFPCRTYTWMIPGRVVKSKAFLGGVFFHLRKNHANPYENDA